MDAPNGRTEERSEKDVDSPMYWKPVSSESARSLDVQHGSVWLQGFVLAGLAVLITFVFERSVAFEDFEAWSYDTTVVLVGLEKTSHDVVFVDFDEDSFDHIRQFPIPRSIIADAITRVGHAGPRVIGLDLFLSEPRMANEDEAMRKALDSAAVVILASQLPSRSLPATRPLASFCEPEQAAAISGFCKEGSGALGYAFINLPADPDGYIRHAPLLAAGAPPSVSFPVMLAQQYRSKVLEPADRSHARFDGKLIPFASTEWKTFSIGSWSPSPALHISAWDLLRGRVPEATLHDKLVLIGQSNDAARDLHLSPLFRTADAQGERRRMPGTQIHAAAILTLLNGTAVGVPPSWLMWTCVSSASLLCAFALLRLRLRYAVLLSVVAAFLVFLTSLSLYGGLRVWLSFLPVLTGMALVIPLTLGFQFVLERTISRQSIGEREHIMSLFSSYVDPAVARTIWERRSEVSLSGESREATVMFTDIRGFTALSAGQSPAEVLRWLNLYLSAMHEVIQQHNGFLNKFIGDGLMVIFGLPLSNGVQQDAIQGVCAAIAMLDRVEQLNEEHAADGSMPRLRIGIGMHTGPLVAGSIGSVLRQEYSVIGATVNLASRLESMNKAMKTEFLLSRSTYDLVRESFPQLQELGEIPIAGLTEHVSVFGLERSLNRNEPVTRSAATNVVEVCTHHA